MKDPARGTVRAGSGCVLRYRTKQGACPPAGYPFAGMAGGAVLNCGPFVRFSPLLMGTLLW